VDGHTDTTAHDHTARIARIAWLCAFVVPLILAALLLGVKSAQAASPLPSVVPLVFEEELLEDEEGLGGENEAEFAEEECEIAEEEAAEGEISEAEARAFCKEIEQAIREAAAGPSSAASAKCALRTAHAHAVVRRNRLKLTVGYTTTASTSATVQVRSGAKRLVSVHRRLGRSGVLRIAKKLGNARVKRLTVRFKTPSCGMFQTRSVKVR
jgi:polyhydroxyalkanoate synthesis regulator phasin